MKYHMEGWAPGSLEQNRGSIPYSGEIHMLVGKKRESIHNKKTSATDRSSEDTVQSLRSWIQKIEQSTNSVSSRLAAVETRLSGGFVSSDEGLVTVMEGPVETMVTSVKNRKKRTMDEQAKVIDHELHFLYTSLQKREQEFQSLKDHMTEMEQLIPTVRDNLRSVHAMTAQMETKMQLLEQRKPLVMKLGAMEIPIEVTGIIGGLLAFTIAILVAMNQKTVLLSPVFLTAVGILLIGSAMVKMIRMRSRATSDPVYSVPFESSASHPASVKSSGDDS